MLSAIRVTAAAAVLSLLPSVFAQTYTDCDPTKKDCPPNPALGTSARFNWTETGADKAIWNTTLGKIDFSPDGALFKVQKQRDAPTIESTFYIFWGRVSVVMKAAPGQGIVSSVVLESSDLDEIDWEWIGGNTTHVQTNFFGKGDTTSFDRAIWHEMDNTLDSHNYTVVWTQDQIDWYIDDNKIRTLPFDDPVAMSKDNKTATVGDRYPQTPMSIKLGNWAGGDPELNNNGTVEWSGGNVDYSKGPFVQTITQVEVQDFSSGKEYIYSDRSGSWQSIKATAGNSTVADRLSKPQGINAQFNALSHGVKAGIVIGAISVAAIIVLLVAFCCIKNRRAGKKEKAAADAEWETNLQELQRYKRMMVAEEEIHPRAGYI